MGQLLAEYEDNALKRQYTYASYIDEPLTLTRYDANLPTGEEILWYHRDRQYNVIGLTSAAGIVIERYAYTPYGERRVLNPDGTTERQTSAVGNPLGHQGLYHDDETGLIYNRARYRDAGLGRWLGRDRLGYIDGWNLYQYLLTKPYMYVDFNGLLVSRPGHWTERRKRRNRRYDHEIERGRPDRSQSDFHARNGANYRYTIECDGEKPKVKSGWTHDVRGLADRVRSQTADDCCCLKSFTVSTHHNGSHLYANPSSGRCSSTYFAGSLKLCDGGKVDLDVCNGRNIADDIIKNNPHTDFDIEHTDGENRHFPTDSHGNGFDLPGFERNGAKGGTDVKRNNIAEPS